MLHIGVEELFGGGRLRPQISARRRPVRTSKFVSVLLLLFVPLAVSMAQNPAIGNPVPFRLPDRGATTAAFDRGALAEQSPRTPLSVTLALRLRNVDEAENLLVALLTPGDAEFHHFLTANQFRARFAPEDAEVARVISALEKYGLAVQQTTTSTLKVTGLPSQMEQAFNVTLHSYEVPTHGTVRGYEYHAPLSYPTIPAEIAPAVSALAGLDSRPAFHPASVHSAQARAASAAPAGTPKKNQLGYLTVTDFANYYDVEPLYTLGLTGKGRTLGIVTLANFTPSDVFAYWSAVGLTVDPNRLQVVNIDGGPGAPSDASDSLETTLDVEQSGGIAPGAKIIVYQAPNTNQGWVDAFAAAVESNSAETLSTSWGEWEWYTNLENGPVTDPVTGQTVGTAQALHELFLRAAIQGQTLFAASGDYGAYAANEFPPCFPSTSPSCSITLSMLDPASDPAITAAGGTTLPGLQAGYCLNSACTPPYWNVDIPHERVWGWDYLEGLCIALGIPDPIACNIFPDGSGGGVSILYPQPSYQSFLPGIQLTQPGQSWIVNGGSIFTLPSNYPGRNVPDISFNADPETGYVIYYTSDVSGFSVLSFWGGTSFVAPQLNGVCALLGEELQSRLGLLNYPLYAMAQNGTAYKGPNAPLHAIAYGDNWFYYGSQGYNLGVGLGTLDVPNFADFLRGLF